MKSAIAGAVFVALLGALPAAAGDPSAKPAPRAVDGDTAYKANCTRCHVAVHTYSPRTMSTLIMHMRVRANLTKDEADAILRYMSGEDQRPKVASQNSTKGAVTQ